MDFEQYMTNSLSALLNKGESLQLSFYGILRTGNLVRPYEYHCFFGLAGEDLLIVNWSPLFRKNRFSARIPFHADHIKIKKSWMGDKYRLFFRLDHAEHPFQKFRITVKCEQPRIKSQRENVAAFLSHVEICISETY